MFRPVPPGYYETEHWKRKRREALEHYGFTCQRCGRFYGRGGAWVLDVHHTPEAYQDLWHESVLDLKPLCSERSSFGKCHKKGRYTAAEIRSDRDTLRFIRTCDRAFSALWRAVRWTIRLPLRGIRALRRAWRGSRTG
jgi:hypothetical protein